jgi:hypothetical protein
MRCVEEPHAVTAGATHHRTPSRLATLGLAVPVALAAAGAIASIDAYSDGATSTTKLGANIVWTYVVASLGLLAVSLALLVGAPRGRAITVAITGVAIAAAFIVLRPNVEPHSSSDGLWVLAVLLGLGVDVLLASVLLIARFGDSSWWRDKPQVLAPPDA